MKKIIVALALVVAFSFAAPAVANEKMASMGLGFNMPYRLDPSSGRGSFGMDVIGEYYLNPNFALHLYFSFEFEQAKAIWLDPGMKYYFMADSMIQPYVGAQVVLGLKNAAVTSSMNYGFRIPFGVNFDLGETTGLEGLNTFLEFSFWGVFKDTSVWNIDIFRLGFSYAF